MTIASDFVKAVVEAAEKNQPKTGFENTVTISYDVNYDSNVFTATVQLPIDGVTWDNTASKLTTAIADCLEVKPPA